MNLNETERYLIRRTLNAEAAAVLDLEQKALAAGDEEHFLSYTRQFREINALCSQIARAKTISLEV